MIVSYLNYFVLFYECKTFLNFWIGESDSFNVLFSFLVYLYFSQGLVWCFSFEEFRIGLVWLQEVVGPAMSVPSAKVQRLHFETQVSTQKSHLCLGRVLRSFVILTIYTPKSALHFPAWRREHGWISIFSNNIGILKICASLGRAH